MTLAKENTIYSYIPKEYRAIVEEEITSYYRIFSNNTLPPCLDETIMNRLGFYHLAICYYHDNDKKMIDEEWLTNPNLWEELSGSYAVQKYPKEFLMFRNDVQNYLDKNNFFYESNWVFTQVPGEYNCVTNNPPIISVW